VTWHSRLEHRFIDRIPRSLEPGVLYISMEYATAAHSCACGCGQEVMTPITPTDWSLTFDGESVSLWPSIGNWQLACRSHYIVDQGRVVRSGAWTPRQIEGERRRDKAAKARHYGTSAGAVHTPGLAAASDSTQGPLAKAVSADARPDTSARPKKGLFAKLFPRI